MTKFTEKEIEGVMDDLLGEMRRDPKFEDELLVKFLNTMDKVTNLLEEVNQELGELVYALQKELNRKRK